MAQFIDTDEEMMAYMDAEDFARARIPAQNLDIVVEHDRVSNREKLYSRLSSGALVLVNERTPTANQTLVTNEAKRLKDIQESGPQEAQVSETPIAPKGRFPIETVQGGRGGPALDDYLAAGYSEEEFGKYEDWRRQQLLDNPNIAMARNMSPSEIEQYSQQIGAELMQPMDETFRSQGREATRQLLTEDFGMDDNAAEMLSDTLWGTGIGRTPIGGAVDFTGLGGLMALQEGRRMFEQGMNSDDALTTGMGILQGLLGAIEVLPYASAATDPIMGGIRGMEPKLRSAIERLRGMQSESGAQ